MRSVAESRARSSVRVAVLTLLAAAAAGCSTDISRFNDNPFSTSQAAKSTARDTAMARDGAMAAPRGQVDAQSLPPPSRPNISSTAPSTSHASHVAAPARARPAAPQAAAQNGIHVVGPGESLTSIGRLYGKSRQELAQANDLESSSVVRAGQRRSSRRALGRHQAGQPFGPGAGRPAGIGSPQTQPAAAAATSRRATSRSPPRGSPRPPPRTRSRRPPRPPPN